MSTPPLATHNPLELLLYRKSIFLAQDRNGHVIVNAEH
jgi:hypothetical protein